MTPEVTTVVFNPKRGSFPSFRIKDNGEIVITSTDPRDTDENCIVTTWDQIYRKNLKK